MQTSKSDKRSSKPLHILIKFSDYAEQTLALNRMRGMLEDEMTDKRNKMMKDL